MVTIVKKGPLKCTVQVLWGPLFYNCTQKAVTLPNHGKCADLEINVSACYLLVQMLEN